MSSFGSKKRRSEIQISRIRQPRGAARQTVEDFFPFEVPNFDTLPPEVKQYINELQSQYLQRYNILVNNRIIYEQMIESIATELDDKGVTTSKLLELFKTTSKKVKTDENSQ